ncbi:MAG TPA: kelch repeat-containing protein [Polyangia bacterium]|nr:kelch repeat-containing protein [Polyangia bacterium]
MTRAPADVRALALVLLLGGCGNGAIDVQLRVPGGDHPLAGADHVAVTLRDGAGATLAFARSAGRAQALTLAPVVAGDGYTVEVDATFNGDVIARGRSCRFDVSASKPPAVPVWFSRVGRFALTSAPAVAREQAVAIAWGDGALVVGGASGGSALASTELYDVPSATFGAGPLLTTPRAGARAVLLADGTALVIGGAAKGAPALEALTAAHSTPEPAGLSPEIVEHVAALASDGSVVVAGGRVGGVALPDAWRITDGGASVGALPPMAHARAGATLISASSDAFAPLLVVGGLDETGAPVAEIETFDPRAGVFADGGIALATPRADHTVTRLPTGLLLVVGGVDAGGAPIAGAEVIDPVNHVARPVASLRTARSHHVATMLPSGRVLVTGGLGADGAPLADAEIFDPELGPEGDFVPTAPLDTPRADHALLPLCDGTWLVVGGGPGAEIYNPL